jgi:hypothetical protein
MRFLFVGGVLCCASTALAQDPASRRLEFDGWVGHTVVDVETWGEVPMVSRKHQRGTGVLARLLLTRFGHIPVGIEVGSQRFFWYEIELRQPVIATQTNVIAGTQVMVFGRFLDTARFFLDAGAGFQGTGEETIVGLMTSANMRLIRRPRFSIPVGARLNLLLNEPAFATALSAKVGISIPLERASTSRNDSP